MSGLLIGAAALAALYLYLVAPNLKNAKQRCGQIPKIPFAHRGLHDGAVPENSLAAFRRAAEKGYGVELDVHLTKDGQLAILHDPSLSRMCGRDQRIFDLTMDELSACRLLGTEETIPSLKEVLRLLAPYGTPLIVEMKSDGRAGRGLPAKLLECMTDYPGFWCAESFNPLLVRWIRYHAPHVLRGQLAYDPRKTGEKGRPLCFFLGADMLTGFLSRPDFVAYQHESEGNLSFRAMRRVFHPFTVAWTVRSEQDFEHLRNSYDLQIFEGFEPPLSDSISEKEREKLQ